MTLYKVLGSAGEPMHGGSGKWHLPTGNRPGKWMPALRDLEPCRRGYHVCTLPQLLNWLGPRIWEVEVRSDRIDANDKIVVSQARLVRPTLWDEQRTRLFAADCAERVLHIFEAACPGDSRARDAIRISRQYALGRATEGERAAARAAAWGAARAAARDAAEAVAWGAARDAARDAARAAAGDAAKAVAWGAARAAAREAARAAEYAWQAGRLHYYLYTERV